MPSYLFRTLLQKDVQEFDTCATTVLARFDKQNERALGINS